MSFILIILLLWGASNTNELKTWYESKYHSYKKIQPTIEVDKPEPIEVIVKDPFDNKSVKWENNIFFEDNDPRDWNQYKGQELVKEFVQLQIDVLKPSEGLKFLFIAPPGYGKAQPHSSKVLTSRGWKCIGDLNKNDLVITPDNNQSKILDIYPQGVKDTFLLKFKDGRTTRATSDHLWNVYYNRRWAVKTTAELIKLLASNIKISIDLPTYLDLGCKKTSELPIDPYVLGIYIGDGGSYTPNQVVITSNDSYIVDKCNDILNPYYHLHPIRGRNIEYSVNCTNNLHSRKLLYKDYQEIKQLYKAENINQYELAKKYNLSQASISRICNSDNYNKNVSLVPKFSSLLTNLGLFNKRAHEKHIPSLYLESSIESRIKLLKGLMDSDGHVGINGNLSFTTTSKQLSEDFVYLVRSLGGVAKTSERYTTYSYNGNKKIGRLSYRISIRFRDREIAFSLPRKLNRINNNYQYRNSFYLELVEISKSDKELCSCILIDDPKHLYVTDNFIITHNTNISRIIANKIINKRGGRYIEVTPSMLRTKKQVDNLMASMMPYDIIFIDEVHLFDRKIADTLLPAIEDGVYPFDEGMSQIASPITWIAGTTDVGLLPPAFQDRFQVRSLERLTDEQLAEIIKEQGFPIEHESALDIAKRATGSPRELKKIFRVARDIAVRSSDRRIENKHTTDAFRMLDLDPNGLYSHDRKVLNALMKHPKKYASGKLVHAHSERAIRALTGMDEALYRDQVEPKLLQQGFITISTGGRELTDKAWETYFR